MRDPDRLDTFYAELCKVHKEHFPDWRFGQLCSNFFGWLAYKEERDIFFVEEEHMIEYLKTYGRLFKEKSLIRKL